MAAGLKALPSGKPVFSMSSHKRSMPPGVIGPFPSCRHGYASDSRKIFQNKRYGIAWTSSSIHTNQHDPLPWREAPKSKKHLKRGPRTVRGVVEKQTVRALFL